MLDNSVQPQNDMKMIINHLNNFGIVYQTAKLYGGIANCYDYGPIGAQMKQNIIMVWTKYFIHNTQYFDNKPYPAFLYESPIFTPEAVLAHSGHLDKFNDEVIECKNCHHRQRVDHYLQQHQLSRTAFLEQLDQQIINCSYCQKTAWTNPLQMDLLFKINNSQQKNHSIYLRPETAQGIFINLLSLLRLNHGQLPLCIGQIGKAFRNEVTPGNFIFRTKEFSQLELEILTLTQTATPMFDMYQLKLASFCTQQLNLDQTKIKIISQPQTELAHYSLRTSDVLYHFPFGWEEICGLANRGQYDLQAHFSDLFKEHLIDKPQTIESLLCQSVIIEPSMGIERLLLAILCDAFKVDQPKPQLINTNKPPRPRIYLKLTPQLAACQIAIGCVVNDNLEQQQAMLKLVNMFRTEKNYRVMIANVGSVGQRYVHHDGIGTPYFVMISHDKITAQLIYRCRNRDDIFAVSDYTEKTLAALIDFFKSKLN